MSGDGDHEHGTLWVINDFDNVEKSVIIFMKEWYYFMRQLLLSK